jgi:hypothetical protein
MRRRPGWNPRAAAVRGAKDVGATDRGGTVPGIHPHIDVRGYLPLPSGVKAAPAGTAGGTDVTPSVPH